MEGAVAGIVGVYQHYNYMPEMCRAIGLWEAHIGRLLTGVARQTRLPDRVIVVDSGSTDATVSIAQAFGAETVSIAPETFSFGHALNVGLRCSSDASLAVFASAHVYPVYDTWVEHLVAPFSDPGVALSYGRQQTPPGGRFSEQRVLEHWFPAVSVPRQRHPFCNNANVAIRREVWDELPYDEDLTGLEDLDWARRALDRGWSLSYVAEAPVIHVHTESFAHVVNRYRREAIAHKQIYNEQHLGAARAAGLAVANIAGDLHAAARGRVPLARVVDIPRFRTAQFLGTYQGFAQAGPITDVLRRRFYYPPASGATRAEPAPGQNLGSEIDYETHA